MAQTPQCWVEFCRQWVYFDGELSRPRWYPVIDGSNLIEWDMCEPVHHLYGPLFGVWRPGIEIDDMVPGPMAQRGIPRDISIAVGYEVVKEFDDERSRYLDELLQGYDHPEEGFPKERLYGWDHTWVMWAEMKPLQDQPMPVGWRSLFSMMELLAANYGEDNVRLIFWIVK